MRTHRLVPERSRARVIASAPGHRFRPEGSGVEGYVRLENGQVMTLLARFPLAALDAGDPLGNRELKKFLRLDTGPLASVELAEPFKFDRSGEGRLRFTLGAKTIEIVAEFEGTPAPAGFSASARFELTFSALGYTPPKLLFLSVKDTLQIEISAVLAREEGIA